jgi:ABC-2 type transport system permease protein
MRLFRHQLGGEMRLYFRSRELAFFTFLFPIILMLLLGSVYRHETIKKEHNIKATSYLVAGILGYGVAATAFAGLAIVLVLRRENGVLKRVRGTPLPPRTYLAAVITSTTIVYLIEAAALIALGRLVYHVPLPHQFVSLLLAIIAGALSFAALGIALTAAIRSGDGASAVVNAIYLPISFLAGAFWSAKNFPSYIQGISDVLPLTHFIRLMRNIVVLHQELWSGSNWQELAIVAAWGLGGLILAKLFFRWEPREG